MEEGVVLKQVENLLINFLKEQKDKEYPYNYSDIEDMAQKIYDKVNQVEIEDYSGRIEDLEDEVESARDSAIEFKNDISDILDKYEEGLSGCDFYNSLRNTVDDYDPYF